MTSAFKSINLESATPLLMKQVSKRVQTPQLPGQYCNTSDLWVIETPTGKQPLVESDNTILELLTKTEAVREQDDQPRLLASLTKTLTQVESDDEGHQFSRRLGLTELITKTKADREQDD